MISVTLISKYWKEGVMNIYNQPVTGMQFGLGAQGVAGQVHPPHCQKVNILYTKFPTSKYHQERNCLLVYYSCNSQNSRSQYTMLHFIHIIWNALKHHFSFGNFMHCLCHNITCTNLWHYFISAENSHGCFNFLFPRVVKYPPWLHALS